MSVAFHKGYTLSPNDLQIVIRDINGNPIDPYYIVYSLYDATTGLEVLIGSPDLTPATTGVGMYYANATVPLDANIGDWLIRWNFMESPTSPLIEAVQEFNVVGDNTVVSVTGNPSIDKLVHRLRILIRDNNPDRNYSIDGKEMIDIMANGMIYIISLEEFWEIIEDGRNGLL